MEACHRKNKEVLCEHIPKRIDKPFTFVFSTKQKKTKKKKHWRENTTLMMKMVVVVVVCVGVNEERTKERERARASVVVLVWGDTGNLNTSETNGDGEIIPLVLVVAGRRGGCTYTQRDTSMSITFHSVFQYFI